MTTPLGTPVRGIVPRTGKEVVGYYRGENRFGLHIIDGTRWSGDPNRMPARQALVAEVVPLEGKELETHMYDKWAREILAGTATRADAVASIAKSSRVAKASVSERLDVAIANTKAAIKAAPSKGKAKTAPRPQAAPGRQRLEHVEPAVFAALRDKLGLTNKECAAANEAAGLGSTLSRITELTASKGASSAILAKVTAAWQDYAAKAKVR
jgi:hypothetical protein